MSDQFQPITVTGLELVTISNSGAARQQRDNLLAVFAGLAPVTDAASAAVVAVALREAKAFTNIIEAVRVEKKAPALDFGKRIDAAAADLAATVAAQLKRWGDQHAAWQAEQDRIAEKKRREAWEEEQRIKREAEAREYAAQQAARRAQEAADAEARRVQAELAAKAARARTEEGRARAEAAAAAAAQQAEVDRLNRQQAEEDAAAVREAARVSAIVETRVTASAEMPAKAEGISTRREVEFEVIDIVALYEANPLLVKMEPNTQTIKSALKQLRADQKIPGVRHWFKHASSIR